MEHLAVLKDVSAIIVVVIAVVTIVAKQYAINREMTLRFDRIEEILLEGNGLVRRVERVETRVAVVEQICEERHGKVAREHG